MLAQCNVWPVNIQTERFSTPILGKIQDTILKNECVAVFVNARCFSCNFWMKLRTSSGKAMWLEVCKTYEYLEVVRFVSGNIEIRSVKSFQMDDCKCPSVIIFSKLNTVRPLKFPAR